MSDRNIGEKEEKREEKEEKEHGEKTRTDAVSAVVWAVILIWAGLVFLADNLGWLRGLEQFTTWGIVLLGAGVIVLGEAVVRWLMPEYRRNLGGTLIFGLILIGLGLGDLANWNVIWPILLVVAGAGLLLSGLLRKK